MKKIFFLTVLSTILFGCAYNSNQKTTSPFLGTVKNQYYIINIKVEDEKQLNSVISNLTHKISRDTDSKDSKTNSVKTNGKFSLGKGTEIFALDNQVLIGHDFGNTTSNSVDGEVSIPLSL